MPKKIRLIGHNPNQDLKIELNSPWIEFTSQFISSGFQIVKDNFNSVNIDALIVNSHSKKALSEANIFNLPISKKIMIYWEPFVSYPKIHKKRIRDLYGKVYTPSKLWSEKLNGEYFYWPQGAMKKVVESESEWMKRKNSVVSISGNKFSAAKGELYSLRRKIGLKLSHEINGKYDFFGAYWNRGFSYDFRNYIGQLFRTPINSIDLKSAAYLGRNQKYFLGTPTNKDEIYSQYKFALVIENSQEYISEKIFDALRSQCIVIYIGTNLKYEDLKSDLAITVEPNYQSLVETITRVLEIPDKEKYKILVNQQRIAREATTDRDNRLVLKNLGKTIVKYLKNHE